MAEIFHLFFSLHESFKSLFSSLARYNNNNIFTTPKKVYNKNEVSYTTN